MPGTPGLAAEEGFMTDFDEAPRTGGARRAPRSMRMSRRDRRRFRAAQAAPAKGGRRALRGPDVAQSRTATRGNDVPRGGRRALRPFRRRTRGLAGTLGLTFIGAMVPGIGYLFAGRKFLGWLVLLGWAAVFGSSAWYFGRDWHRAVDLVFAPNAIKIAAIVIASLLLVWLGVVWTSYRLIRPRVRPRWHTVIGNVAVIVVCALFAAPVVRAVQYAVATDTLVNKVFDNNKTATVPDLPEDDPWKNKERVSVLLLGGDGGDGRDGVRTDSMILLSINTRTGKAVTFSLPRNFSGARFPEGSPLQAAYPNGFTVGDPANGEYMMNAIYRNVPAQHPGILGKSHNEGADAIKQAFEGTLGIPVDYYVLVNLDGFREVVNAIGGVTVNINEPIAIGGDTSAGIPPTDYLAPGPNQHLDGFHALWFARGRWHADDYERMDRQRCMVDAIVKAADPASLLLRYLDLIRAGERIIYTDIPRAVGPAFVDLALKVKGAKIKSVVFKTSERFSSANPDFDYIHETVQRALNPVRRNSADKRDPAEDPTDACAYRPTGETVADALAADAPYR